MRRLSRLCLAGVSCGHWAAGASQWDYGHSATLPRAAAVEAGVSNSLRSAKKKGQPWGQGIPVSQGPDFCCPLAGTGPIHLNEVQCRGTEKSLWNCPSRNITQEDCKHSEDAAVRCNIPYMGYENLVRTTGGCWLHGAPSSGASKQGAGKGQQDLLLCTPHISPSSGARDALGAQGFCGWEPL